MYTTPPENWRMPIGDSESSSAFLQHSNSSAHGISNYWNYIYPSSLLSASEQKQQIRLAEEHLSRNDESLAAAPYTPPPIADTFADPCLGHRISSFPTVVVPPERDAIRSLQTLREAEIYALSDSEDESVELTGSKKNQNGE